MAKKGEKGPEQSESAKTGEIAEGGSHYPSPFEDMERWFEETMHRPFFGPMWWPRPGFSQMPELLPLVDIFEDGDDVVVKAEVPGMKKEEIEVNLSGDIITISGHKKAEEKVEKKDFYRIERSFGSFSRRLRLPAEVVGNKANASFKDGILEVRIPKTAAAKAKKKKINIG